MLENEFKIELAKEEYLLAMDKNCLLYTYQSPRDY